MDYFTKEEINNILKSQTKRSRYYLKGRLEAEVWKRKKLGYSPYVSGESSIANEK